MILNVCLDMKVNIHMCVHVTDRKILPLWLSSHTYRQTDRQTDSLAGYISTHAKCCLAEWESALVVMLSGPPGSQTDEPSHGSSLQLSGVCRTLWATEKGAGRRLCASVSVFDL